jgi:TatA/E family protein of Tat protein translocase
MLSLAGFGFTNFGPTELIIILAIILIIFGPKSLPSLGRAMGKGLREFRSASSKLSDAIQSVDEDEEETETNPKPRTAPRQISAPDKDRESIAARPPAHSVPSSSSTDQS